MMSIALKATIARHTFFRTVAKIVQNQAGALSAALQPIVVVEPILVPIRLNQPRTSKFSTMSTSCHDDVRNMARTSYDPLLSEESIVRLTFGVPVTDKEDIVRRILDDLRSEQAE